MNKEIWKTQLEYALPDKLTEKEKQIIRNNVQFICQELLDEIKKELPKEKICRSRPLL